MIPPDKLPPFERLKLFHAQRLDFTRDMVGELLAEVERLTQAQYEEAYEHAACLSIAEGAPGWRDFEPRRAAGHAVKALRERAEANLPPGVTLDFAKAVSEAVAEEREACAKVAEELSFAKWTHGDQFNNGYAYGANDCAAAIRARSK